MIDLAWPLKYHHDIFAGTQRYAAECGNWECQVDVHAGENLRSGRQSLNYDGVIARATKRLVTRAKRARVPVVNVWLNSPVRQVPAVFGDAAAAAQMALDHLLARGVRKFAFLGFKGDRLSRLELSAMRKTLATQRLKFTQLLVDLDWDDEPRKWKLFQNNLGRWIDTWEPPLGVFVSHDIVARYLADVCHRKNVRVPDDAAIVSNFNELSICLQPSPSISSIEFGMEEIGYRAAQLLDEIMSGGRPPEKPILIPPVTLVARQSTDVFAVDDPLISKAMRFIAEHSAERLSVDRVAKHVRVARRTLELRFREAVGRTVSGEIARLRVECVKRQLLESDQPLKTLAARLGFQNEQRLCELFKRVEGISPGEFRRRKST